MNKPWLRFYEHLGGIAENISVPDKTLYEMLLDSATVRPDARAMVYMGRTFTFAEVWRETEAVAAALAAEGVRAGDAVLVSLPNIPNVIFAFYAINRLGARAVMTHPLSSPDELGHYLTQTGAKVAIGVDMFYAGFMGLFDSSPLERLVIAHVPDYLTGPKRLGFRLTKGRAISPPPRDARLIDWNGFMRAGAPLPAYERGMGINDCAVILFSGGTTALPKGIELSSANFNTLAISTQEITTLEEGDSLLTILPAFHGFALGLLIHTPICVGAWFLLVPEFSTKVYIDNLVAYQPNFIAGVPTLFEALARDPAFAKVDFATLKGAYSGGDLLTPDLKHRFDAVIQAHGGTTELREGYGLTESVTACVGSPKNFYREGSLGIPMPGCSAMIADPDSGEELPYGTEGEICVTGPTLMLGYINDPEATAHALRRHSDGETWLHTGDLGTMDADGFLYFRGRTKRLLKVSGVSVYPMQVEQLLEAHPAVNRACVIGVPDRYTMSRVKAFVTLVAGVAPTEELRAELLAYGREHLIRYSAPKELEFRDTLPMTRIGKVAYTELEKEEAAKAVS